MTGLKHCRLGHDSKKRALKYWVNLIVFIAKIGFFGIIMRNKLCVKIYVFKFMCNVAEPRCAILKFVV
jgi:hypothetical protein